MTFNEAVEEMKKLAKGRTWAFKYEVASYCDGPQIHGYIDTSNGFGHAKEATTYAEAIENVKKMLNPPIPDLPPEEGE